MIATYQLSRTFNGGPAVEELTFTIPEGEPFVLLGPEWS
jgi:ABC-type multidrug transport system ATPase subunit